MTCIGITGGGISDVTANRKENVYKEDGAFSAKDQGIDVTEREDVKDKNGMSANFPYGSAFSK